MDWQKRLKQVAPEFRLSRFYHLAGLIGVGLPLIIAWFISYFSDYFIWLQPDLTVWLLVSIAVVQAICFLLHKLFQHRIFWHILAGAWIIFYFAILIVSGGVESSLIFLLIIPLLGSATRLNGVETKWVAIITTLGLSSLIFLEPDHWQDPSVITRHAIHTVVFALIAFYIYKIVQETLKQKYDKQEAERRFNSLVEINQVKENFLTVASHQLRTPLAGARWGVNSVLESVSLADEEKRLLQDSRDRIEKATEIVGELIETAEASMDKYKYKFKFESVNLIEVIIQALDELQPLVEENRVQISKQLPSEVVVEGDRYMLSSAVANLLDNAIRYSPEGRVEISLESLEKEVKLEMADNGIGVSLEDRGHIFDRFYRGKNALLTSPSRSGVGLSLAERIVQHHGGRIKLESKLDQGTTVTVFLPFKLRSRHSGQRV